MRVSCTTDNQVGQLQLYRHKTNWRSSSVYPDSFETQTCKTRSDHLPENEGFSPRCHAEFIDWTVTFPTWALTLHHPLQGCFFRKNASSRQAHSMCFALHNVWRILAWADCSISHSGFWFRNCNACRVWWMTVFSWRSDAVVLHCGYTAFTPEIVLTSPVRYAILGFVTNIQKNVEANFRLPFSLIMNSICKLLHHKKARLTKNPKNARLSHKKNKKGQA